MRIRAAVLEEFGRPLVVQELDLAEPRADVHRRGVDPRHKHADALDLFRLVDKIACGLSRALHLLGFELLPQLLLRLFEFLDRL